MTPFLLLSAICTSIGFLTAILPVKPVPHAEPKDKVISHHEFTPLPDPGQPF
jgi:hypothetical protein